MGEVKEYIKIPNLFSGTVYLPMDVMRDFITINSPPETDVDKIMDELFMAYHGGWDNTFFQKDTMLNSIHEVHYEPIVWEWVNAFFTVHPEITTDVMFIYDD